MRVGFHSISRVYFRVLLSLLYALVHCLVGINIASLAHFDSTYNECQLLVVSGTYLLFIYLPVPHMLHTHSNTSSPPDVAQVIYKSQQCMPMPTANVTI